MGRCSPSPAALKPHHKDPTLPTPSQVGLQLCLLTHASITVMYDVAVKLTIL